MTTMTRGLTPLVVRHRDNGNTSDRGVSVKGIFDFNRGDVLTAGDDDVFRSVFQFHIAIRVHDT